MGIVVRTSVLAALLFVSCAAVFAAEKGKPEFDGREWKLGWSKNRGGVVFEEYVLAGETVENWSELVTIQFLPGVQKDTNPDVFEGIQRRNLTMACPEIVWRSVSQSNDERIWEWSIQNCQGQPDQSEIARLVRTDSGFHVFHYAAKKAPFPVEVHETWLEKLKAIQIIKN